MGYLDFDDESEKKHLTRIRQILRRRNMVPVLNDEPWQVHGPHPNMDYQVFIGEALNIHDRQRGPVCVAIFPWGTYEISDESQWANWANAERIPVVKK